MSERYFSNPQIEWFIEPLLVQIVATPETSPRAKFAGTSWKVKLYEGKTRSTTPTQLSLQNHQWVTAVGREGNKLK
jgi:hypothetical protein